MKQFTDSDFANEITSGTVVVDFYADWCSPCRMLAHTFTKVASSFANIKFGKVDIDSNPEITGKYKINSLPTILIFKDGSVVQQLTGIVNENALTSAVQNA
jgi:thioredoxin 1